MEKTIVNAKKPKKTERLARTQKICYCALMTAIIAALSQVAFPLPSGVPVTLQTFAVALCGYFGGVWGAAACCIYLLLGLVGVPVFANFKGGISAITGLTGGFLVGFVPMILLCCIPTKFTKPLFNAIVRILLGCVGLVICHLLGAWWFSYQSGNDFVPSVLLVSVPYLAKDVVSVAAGYFIAEILKKRVKNPFVR